MAGIADLQCILDILLLLTHPSQHAAAVTVIESLRANHSLNARTPHQMEWPSRVWQGISVIINRITRPHRDMLGPAPAFDLLLAGGSTTHADLQLPRLGASLQYHPGTVVLILAKYITHEVPEWSHGDRVCYAQWLRSRSVAEGPISNIDWCRLDNVRAQWALLRDRGRGM